MYCVQSPFLHDPVLHECPSGCIGLYHSPIPGTSTEWSLSRNLPLI